MSLTYVRGLKLSRFFSFVGNSLKKRPVTTNVVIYASFFSAAEMSQQTISRAYAPENKKPDYDFKHLGKLVGFSVVYAPFVLYWYRYLDRTFPGYKLRAVVLKMSADQFFMTPFVYLLFFSALGLVSGKEDIFEELREKYLRTVVANECFWIPGQTINFGLIPPQYRLVYVSAVSFVWINVLCLILRPKTTVEEKH